eukprot:1183131-Rhodomonas_salina.1
MGVWDRARGDALLQQTRHVITAFGRHHDAGCEREIAKAAQCWPSVRVIRRAMLQSLSLMPRPPEGQASSSSLSVTSLPHCHWQAGPDPIIRVRVCHWHWQPDRTLPRRVRAPPFSTAPRPRQSRLRPMIRVMVSGRWHWQPCPDRIRVVGFGMRNALLRG